MRKIIEYALVSIDGVFAGPHARGFMDYRDDAYIRDGLGQLMACEAMLMGRTTYENFATMWPGRTHPWADRINAIKKYVFSLTLERAEWNNSTMGRVAPGWRTAQRPHLMPVEVATILRRAAARGEITPDVASMAHADLLDLRVELFPYAPFAPRVWELRDTVTSNDAWYVALAESLGSNVAALDRRLARATGPRCGFETPPTRPADRQTMGDLR